jgi:hypothetical protein
MEIFCSSDIGLNFIDVCIERIFRNVFLLLLLNPRIVSIWRVSQPSDSVHELRESTFSTGSVLADCHFAVTLCAEEQ